MGNVHSSFTPAKSFKKQKSPFCEPEPMDFVKELKYYLPNNFDDVDRLNIYHFLKRHVFQSNFNAPIEGKLIQGECKVLDVACGSGAWLLDLSTEYEKSHFFGLDINPIYPNQIKPRNLKFIRADVFNGLPFPDNEFDFVHQETMAFIIKTNQWEFIISELVRVTKPGGYIEICESVETPKGMGPIMEKLDGLHVSCSLQRGVDLKSLSLLDKTIESNQKISKLYRDDKMVILGQNGGKVGKVLQEVYMMFHSSEAAMENFRAEMEISEEEYKEMVMVDLVEELKITQPEISLTRFWAQKNQ